MKGEKNSGQICFIMLATCISRPGTLGGNTRIFLELTRRWAKIGCQIVIITNELGNKTCKNYSLVNKNIHYILIRSRRYVKFGRPILHPIEITKVIEKLNKNKIYLPSGKVVIYSASNAWPDVIPAVWLKMKRPEYKWIGSNYLPMPNPFRGLEQAYERSFKPKLDFRVLAGFLVERSSTALIKRYADAVFVTNDCDKQLFLDVFPEDRIRAIYGGIDLKEVDSIPEQPKVYEGCFVGRIHPQKGIKYLIDIWDYIVEEKPEARLAIIGTGDPLFEKKIRAEVKRRNLSKNIIFYGFVDGREKYRILKSAKVFLHTSIYDNCGMAAAEAMAAGLPVVRFDIPALKLAFPQGTIAVPLKNCRAFATQVIKLLNEVQLYAKKKKEAINDAKRWDWDSKAIKALKFIERMWF